MARPLLSILMISYSTREETEKSLQAVINSTKNISREIIVTDNNSDDGSADMIENEFPDVTLIRNEKNRYFAPAFNDMFLKANGKYVMIINSDLYTNQGAVNSIMTFFQDTPNCGIASCLITGTTTDNTSYYAHNYWNKRNFSSIVRTLYPIRYYYDKKRKKTEILSTKPNDTIIMPEVTSDAFIIIRNDVLEQLNGYLKGLRLYYTEDDICIRTREMGYEIVILTDVSVTHDKGKSSIKQNCFNISLIAMTDLSVYARRHLGNITFLLLIPFQIMHLSAMLLYTVLKKRYKSH